MEILKAARLEITCLCATTFADNMRVRVHVCAHVHVYMKRQSQHMSMCVII